MAEQSLISGDYLLGIHAALALHAPNLQHHVRTLLRRGPVVSSQQEVAEAIDNQFSVELHVPIAAAILDALRQVEVKFGRDRLFFDNQIGMLVSTWHGHVARLEARNGP